MPYRPYVDLDPDDLSLRDQLAADRTVLANERTLLAHVRTALGLLGGGGALVYVSSDIWLIVVGVGRSRRRLWSWGGASWRSHPRAAQAAATAQEAEGRADGGGGARSLWRAGA